MVLEPWLSAKRLQLLRAVSLQLTSDLPQISSLAIKPVAGKPAETSGARTRGGNVTFGWKVPQCSKTQKTKKVPMLKTMLSKMLSNTCNQCSKILSKDLCSNHNVPQKDSTETINHWSHINWKAFSLQMSAWAQPRHASGSDPAPRT